MKGLMVAFCVAVTASAGQADSVNCRRIGCRAPLGEASHVPVLGNYVYVADDMFGLRTIEVMDLRSSADGAYSYAQDSARRAAARGGHAYVAEAGGALVGGVLVGAGAGVALGLAGGIITGAGNAADPDAGMYAGILVPAAVGLALGYPCGCAMGTVTVGRWKECEGNVGRAYSGAFLGMVVAVPVMLFGGPIAVVGPLLPPAGAVIGYNARDVFGLRTTDVPDLRSPVDGEHSYAQDSARRAVVLGGRRAHAAEAGGALVGGVLVGAGAGFALGMAGMWIDATISPDNQWTGLAGLVVGGAGGIALGYPAGCAMGAATVGRWMGHDGSTGRGYAGAYLGLPIGVGLIWLGARVQGAAALLIPVGVLAPLAGAVIGYNAGESSLSSRLAPPTLAYSTRLGPDRQRYSAFDCRLVTVRF